MIHYSRRFRRQRGRSLLETIIVLGLATVFIGLALREVVAVRQYNREVQGSTEANYQLSAVERLLQEDLTNAAKGTRDAAKGARVLCRATRLNRPAAFVSDDGQTLTILQTTPDEPGHIAAVAPGKLILSDVDPTFWTSLPSGSALVVVPAVGDPALWRLSASPRPATPADFPPPAVAANFKADRCLVVPGAVASVCGPVGSVGSTVSADSLATPLQNIVVYRGDRQAGLVRDEYVECETAVSEANRIVIVPLTTPARFRYLTDDGPADAAPSDLNRLRGIQVLLEIDIPNTGRKMTRPVEVEPKEWRRG